MPVQRTTPLVFPLRYSDPPDNGSFVLKSTLDIVEWFSADDPFALTLDVTLPPVSEFTNPADCSVAAAHLYVIRNNVRIALLAATVLDAGTGEVTGIAGRARIKITSTTLNALVATEATAQVRVTTADGRTGTLCKGAIRSAESFVAELPPPDLASIALTPSSWSSVVTDTLALALSLVDTDGLAYGGTRSVGYASSDPTVATVDADGLVTLVATGSAVITVTVTAPAGVFTATTTVTGAVATIPLLGWEPMRSTTQRRLPRVMPAQATNNSAPAGMPSSAPIMQQKSTEYFRDPTTWALMGSRLYSGADDPSAAGSDRGFWDPPTLVTTPAAGRPFAFAAVAELTRTPGGARAWYGQIPSAHMNSVEDAQDRQTRNLTQFLAVAARDGTQVGKVVYVRTRLDNGDGSPADNTVIAETRIVLPALGTWVWVQVPIQSGANISGSANFAKEVLYVESDPTVPGESGLYTTGVALAFLSAGRQDVLPPDDVAVPQLWNTALGAFTENGTQNSWLNSDTPVKLDGSAIGVTTELVPDHASYFAAEYFRTVTLAPGEGLTLQGLGYTTVARLSNIGVSQLDDPGEPSAPLEVAWGGCYLAPEGSNPLPADGDLGLYLVIDPAQGTGATSTVPLKRDTQGWLRGPDGRAFYRGRVALNIVDAGLSDNTLRTHVHNYTSVRPVLINQSATAKTFRITRCFLTGEGQADTRNQGWHDMTVPPRVLATPLWSGGSFNTIPDVTKITSRTDGWFALRVVLPFALDEMVALNLGKRDLWQSGPPGSALQSFEGTLYPNQDGDGKLNIHFAMQNGGGFAEWSIDFKFDQGGALYPAGVALDIAIGWKAGVPIGVGIASGNGAFTWVKANGDLFHGNAATVVAGPGGTAWSLTAAIGLMADRDVTGMSSSYLQAVGAGNDPGASADFPTSVEAYMNHWWGARGDYR